LADINVLIGNKPVYRGLARRPWFPLAARRSVAGTTQAIEPGNQPESLVRQRLNFLWDIFVSHQKSIRPKLPISGTGEKRRPGRTAAAVRNNTTTIGELS
jgi:hypothetical protein